VEDAEEAEVAEVVVVSAEGAEVDAAAASLLTPSVKPADWECA
jgi:hypothetical protein